VDGVRVVTPSAGVDQDPIAVPSCLNVANHLSLIIAVPELEIHVRVSLCQHPLYVAKRQWAVDVVFKTVRHLSPTLEMGVVWCRGGASAVLSAFLEVVG
jgi:hypothetical protein